ncbi:MAG: malto-oligosyltrehalose trehalohydrolase, partial [Candidatus Saccharimonadales bacterium]
MEAINCRLPIGAELQPGGGVYFRVWAPRRDKAEVVVLPSCGQPGGAVAAYELTRQPDGYFAGLVAAAGAGT